MLSRGEESPLSFLWGLRPAPPAGAGPSCPSGGPQVQGVAPSLSDLAWEGQWGKATEVVYLRFAGRGLVSWGSRTRPHVGAEEVRTREREFRILPTIPPVCPALGLS